MRIKKLIAGVMSAALVIGGVHIAPSGVLAAPTTPTATITMIKTERLRSVIG